MADGSQRKTLSVLFIKPEDHDTFHELILKHISEKFPKDLTYLTARFLGRFGNRLWSTHRNKRKHLQQSPEEDEVAHWPKRTGRGSSMKGPIFKIHGQMTDEEDSSWRNRHGGCDPGVQNELSGSQLGAVLRLYISDVIDKTRTAPPQELKASLDVLFQRILASRSTATSPKSDKARMLSVTSPTKKGPMENGADFGSLHLQLAAGSSESTMVKGKSQVADHGHGNSIGPTNPAIVNDIAGKRQTRLNDGEEEDNAAEAIRKIRTFVFKDAPMATNSGQGQKRPMPANESSTVPPKKQRKRNRNASPRRGTFVIPPGLHRMEALPLRKPRYRKQIDVSQTGVFRQPDVSASLTDNSQFNPDFRIIEIPFNYMEIVPSMSSPHVDEEERRKTLATYMKETGGMGGLPIVQ